MLQENPRKKPRITKIHLLVHPFYGNRKLSRLIEFLLRIFRLKASYGSYKPKLPVDPLRYERLMARIFGQLVLQVKNNPNEVLVYLPLDWGKRAERFRGFVHESFKPNDQSDSRLVEEGNLGYYYADHSVKTINERFDVDWSQVQLEAHGEMSDYCVNGFLNMFCEATRNEDLIRQARFALDKLKRPNPNARVKINPHTTELIPGMERFVLQKDPLPKTEALAQLKLQERDKKRERRQAVRQLRT